MGGCLAGTLLGVLSPIFFARLGIDPAVASGPIVTAFNDFLSMTIYFLIAIVLQSALL
jgi:magnesium transporter